MGNARLTADSDRLRCEDLDDTELLATVKRLAGSERSATADLIRSLVELDKRRLYLAEGCPSLFAYCTRVLHLSEHAAYGRIEAARTAQRFPRILTLLEQGAITLTTITLLAAHLTPENEESVLSSACGKTRREIEVLIGGFRPAPELGISPAPVSAEHLTQPQFSVIKPVSGEQYRVHMTMTAATIAKLHAIQDLLRHDVPDGDPAAIFDRALSVLLNQLEKAKWAATAQVRRGDRTPGRSRRIPAAVRRTVWQRDGGRCAFVGHEGRCAETGFLEFHHVVPFADGGNATVDNIQLRCRAHNTYEAEQWFAANG